MWCMWHMASDNFIDPKEGTSFADYPVHYSVQLTDKIVLSDTIHQHMFYIRKKKQTNINNKNLLL